MNEVVEEYLEKKQKEIKKQREKAKEEKLVELGLYERIYEGQEGYDPQKANYCWDDEKQQGTYYNKVPIEVTDEEYEEILKVSDEEIATSVGGNTIAKVLKVIAWVIYGVGFIMGLVLSQEPGYHGDEMNIATAFTYWCVTFVSGTTFLGFAEVVKLLEEIKGKL